MIAGVVLVAVIGSGTALAIWSPKAVDAVVAVDTLGLLVVTGGYVWLTGRMARSASESAVASDAVDIATQALRASQEQVAILERQLDEQRTSLQLAKDALDLQRAAAEISRRDLERTLTEEASARLQDRTLSVHIEGRSDDIEFAGTLTSAIAVTNHGLGRRS